MVIIVKHMIMKARLIMIGLAIMCTPIGYCQSQPTSNLKPLNINFKNRGYFYATCPQLEKTSGFGGWADSGNMFVRMNNQDQFPAGQLSVVLKTREHEAFVKKFDGLTLYISNTLSDTIFFDAQDSRLNMILQAKDKDGKWKDIEYLPSSWCGNSYHMVYLPPNNYWRFIIPVYDGKVKTQLRAVLSYKSSIEGDEQIIYSNEFSGSINPGQFSRIPSYKPGGIMDPYNN
jgi:hypothetical protein